MQSRKLIIFSDLDGTLLDHDSYSWEPARPALEQLQLRQIPLILCTSKTAAEVAQLHRAMDLDTAYIVENGGAIVLSDCEANLPENAHFFGRPYLELINLMHRLRSEKNYRFTGFSDFSLDELMRETGLAAQQAQLAKQRLCSEPIRWDDSEKALTRFRAELGRYDLQLLRGGRFHHVLDRTAGKGMALHWLLTDFRRHRPHDKWFSVALGDGPNDRSMLEAADLAVIIPSVTGQSPQLDKGNIMHACEAGPAGWNQAILNILAMHTDKGVSHG